MHNCYTFGTHRHYQIPASLQNTPGFAQAKMIKVLQSIYEQDCNYIDDIRVWDNEKKTAKACGQKYLITRLSPHMPKVKSKQQAAQATNCSTS